MSDKPESYCDPLIDEVRQRRREVFAKYGNDLRKLLAAIQRRQAQHPDKVIDRRAREAHSERLPG